MVVSFAPAVIRTLDALATRPAAGRWGGALGSTLFGSMAPGGGLFSNSPIRAEPRESRHAVVVELSLDGDVRTTMAGADYSCGLLPVGLSVDRTVALTGYRGPSGGRMSRSMTGFYA